MNDAVTVAGGQSVPLRVTMAVAGMAEGIEVTAETPVIDTKKMTTTMKSPTSRPSAPRSTSPTSAVWTPSKKTSA